MAIAVTDLLSKFMCNLPLIYLHNPKKILRIGSFQAVVLVCCYSDTQGITLVIYINHYKINSMTS